jgi:hypothetical protein
MKGDVDWAIAIVNEGLDSMELKKFSSLEQFCCLTTKPRLSARPQIASTSPDIIQSLSKQDKARHVGKRKKKPIPAAIKPISS